MEQRESLSVRLCPGLSQHLFFLCCYPADDCNYGSLLLLYWMHALFVKNYSRTARQNNGLYIDLPQGRVSAIVGGADVDR